MEIDAVAAGEPEPDGDPAPVAEKETDWVPTKCEAETEGVLGGVTESDTDTDCVGGDDAVIEKETDCVPTKWDIETEAVAGADAVMENDTDCVPT
jgi:hypothetical protein